MTQCFCEFVALVGGQRFVLHHEPQAIELLDFNQFRPEAFPDGYVIPREHSVTEMSCDLFNCGKDS